MKHATTTLPASRVVEVRITPDGAEHVKVVWWQTGDTRPYLPYRLPMERLKRLADKARDALSALVAKVKSHNDGWKQCGAELDVLVQCGDQLRKALFRPEDDISRHADSIAQWLADEPTRLCFAIDNISLHVPWGLLCDASEPPPLSPDSPDTRFWAIKHSCSATYRHIWPTLEATNIDAARFFLQPIVNLSVWDRVALHIPSTSLDRYGRLPLRACIHTKRDLLAIWRELRHSPGLLYFLCHASPTGVSIQNDDWFSADDFLHELRRHDPTKDGCVVFLNGCSTAADHPGGTFYNAAQGEGYFGFIACEVTVPDVFAASFGIEFLTHWFASGRPLYEVLRQLHQDHWPLSMVYGLYCYPLVSVNGVPRELTTVPNLSQGRVTSAAL